MELPLVLTHQTEHTETCCKEEGEEEEKEETKEEDEHEKEEKEAVPAQPCHHFLIISLPTG